MELLKTKTKEEIKSMPIADARTEYNKLALVYNDIISGNIIKCETCGGWFRKKTEYYSSKSNALGVYPHCKDCISKEVSYPTETKESVQRMLKKMNLPYIDSAYISAKNEADKDPEDKKTPWNRYITMIKSLPQWSRLTWEQSEFGDIASINEDGDLVLEEARPEIKKTFGSGFSNEDYLYLQDQYDDWCIRTQVDSKSQETYVVQICLQSLDIYKDRKCGKDVTNKLKALDTLMNSANLQPKQNVSNSATDNLTFGQLIEKWEQEEPIPEPTDEFKDVDGIGKYIRVWFAGWLSKAVGLKNVYSEEYEEYIKQYSVSKNDNMENEVTSDQIYEQLFGKDGD